MPKPSLVSPCLLCGCTDQKDYTKLYPAYLPKNALTSATFSARRLPDKIHYQLVRCKNDGLVRSTPIYSQSIISNLYQKSELNYQDQVVNLTQTYLKSLSPVLSKLDTDSAILEIGCGSGFMLEALRKKGFTRLFGIEPSHSAAEQAKTSIRQKIITQPFSKKAMGIKQFDLILLLQTLDHLPNLNQLLEDCYDVLNPGGYIVSVHHNVEFWLVKLLGERHPIFDIEHLQLFSEKTSAALFEKHGFLTVAINSPTNTISLSHLLWLLPLPTMIKKAVVPLLKRVPIFNPIFNLKLGNVSIVVQKPRVNA
ncbi:MAG: hypothetical protein COY81_03050 [Candidatus Pacebacteria bacterium CG_4_10_14_0_8_um_filter_43_12]|nr:MAG: hypothetical protein COU66_03000 [Candidatus Pacebacteria bacterium CG10_big_fil_rev_8_21_14_0_10_44_11]PIY79365.1 MAG: hypothetical protein COY81_03050 [Candidatus Pacebacteria bacterium CG_4_10_14_0_8_um_filter_43_12]